MKVGVIAAEMEGSRTGVGRYLEGLVKGLGAWEHGAEWHFFFQGGRKDDGDLPSWLVPHFSNDHGSSVVWEHLRLPKVLENHALDVVFCPAYSVPFGLRIPSVVTIHDLSFEVLPDEFGVRERWRRRFFARRAARTADRVLADTRHMASLVARRYEVAEDRMAVVPLGVDGGRFDSRRGADDASILGRLGVTTPYVLWVGTVLERRCPQAVMEAIAALRADHPQLQFVIAGANRLRKPNNLQRWIREFGLEGHTVELGWVDEACLAPLYRWASAGVYVSQHEGFGIPPLECLASGTPVVVSAGLGLDEAWPDYPFRCGDRSPDAILEALRRALSQEWWNDATVAESERVLRGFGWEYSSRLLVAVLEQAAAR